jgi:hypothetical protein
LSKILVILSLLIGGQSFAQQIFVEKVKGTKAIVEITNGALETGKSYSIDSKSATDSEGGVHGPRRYLFGASLAMNNLTATTKTTGAETTTAKNNSTILTSVFGWNKETYEIGPTFSFGSTSDDSASTTRFSVGLFFDYNFTPNRAGTPSLWGAGIQASYGSASTTESTLSSKTASSIMSLYPSVFYKWFPFAATGFRADLGYSYEKENRTSDSAPNSEVTTQGLSVRGGVVTYF